MPLKLIGSQPADIPQAVTPPRAPSCPCCAGPLVMLREMYRCARCQYSLCVGCEPVAPERHDYD